MNDTKKEISEDLTKENKVEQKARQKQKSDWKNDLYVEKSKMMKKKRETKHWRTLKIKKKTIVIFKSKYNGTILVIKIWRNYEKGMKIKN